MPDTPTVKMEATTKVVKLLKVVKVTRMIITMISTMTKAMVMPRVVKEAEAAVVAEILKTTRSPSVISL
jgi:hypothetical protein